MKRDNMGDRFKGYENCYRIYLPKRQAVIVRCDMRARRSFTKGFDKPYDEVFAQVMQETAKQLCENISGAKFAYTQSDEISIVLTDYETINTEPWFGNNLQKIVSISASMATLYFNKFFQEEVAPGFDYIEQDEKLRDVQIAHLKALTSRQALFDARTFILPREEVCNYFYLRQLNCVRNSIQSAGQANFSHKELQGLNCDQIQEKLFQEKHINWGMDYPTWFKNGTAVYKYPTYVEDMDGHMITRNKWRIDKNIPMFSANPEFINKHIIF